MMIAVVFSFQMIDHMPLASTVAMASSSEGGDSGGGEGGGHNGDPALPLQRFDPEQIVLVSGKERRGKMGGKKNIDSPASVVRYCCCF